MSEMEQQIIAALGDGNRTWRIARKIGRRVDAVRRVLRRMEAEGRVARCAVNTGRNDIFWLPASMVARGYATERTP